MNIIIAGAGLAGLTASIALASKGHTVTVYERRDDDDLGISASGIQLQPNAVRVLRRFDMMDSIDSVTVSNGHTDLRDFRTGETLALVDMERRGGVRYAVRREMKRAFIKEAEKRGVVLHKGVGVESVGEEASKAVVQLSDGSSVSADLVVGADGTWSRVRKSLFPSYQPSILSTVVFQVQVPDDYIRQHPETQAVDRNNPAICLWGAPGRVSVTGAGPAKGPFDLQMIDVDYPISKDPNPNIRLGWVQDMSWLRERFADHVPGFGMILDRAERYYKWRLVEVSGLPSWSSKGGKVVLIGDASHAMTPYAGQGSAMGIEDAAVIAELLADAKPGDDLRSRWELYEKLRRPRCEAAQKYAAMIGRSWAARSDKMIAKVRQGLLMTNDPAYLSIKPDKNAPFHTAPFEKWLDLYDASAEVEKALNGTDAVQARL
ncbi:uncharacterized protein HMPREF1541_00167 [Cyphellophora europaea CBS 101466]|uniref:FAD-binding domain-containing protein n=1 Tax=Cyphellophora europaea (strain CBS 101466) TaxID=1220924 RepID=W2SBK4_CYPE1|nr:uncharacterized protein HMPREF1541_00167 [Cyphellophora europaea CBS 101466]ETN45985.1 hypothetical protein HMPREF1541_00167 [Cyphellophora europaea CBS 101466]